MKALLLDKRLVSVTANTREDGRVEWTAVLEMS